MVTIQQQSRHKRDVVVKGSSSSSSSSTKRDIIILVIGIVIGLAISMTFRITIGPNGSIITACYQDEMDRPDISQTTQEDTTTNLRSSTSSSVSTSVSSLPKYIPDGMNPIYIYWGKFHHLTDPIPTKWWLETGSEEHRTNKNGSWFSQHGQDVAIAKIFNFKRNGYFVDLAANDAVWASNTFSLEQNFGWKGICIEPNPQYWYRLSFRGNNCHVIGSIVGGTTNVPVDVKLGDAHHGPFGGIIGSNFDNKQPTSKREKDQVQKRYTLSLETILDMFDAPTVIDYLSLDVEGAELYIMKDFPFTKYQFKTLTVERPKAELITLLTQNGYKKLIDIKRGDTLWVHESIYDESKQLIDINYDEIDQHKITKTKIPGYTT